MLVNLGNQDESSVPANSVGSPRAGNNMSSLDDSGEYDQEELGDYGEWMNEWMNEWVFGVVGWITSWLS